MEYAYDQFIDDNPDVQKRVEQRQVELAQQLIIAAIQNRFPALATEAQQQIEQIQKPNVLKNFFLQLNAATTEGEAHEILRSRKTGHKRKS